MANTTNIDLVKPAGTDYALISVINSNYDKIDTEAGKVRANFAGTYSTSSAYAVGAYCIYQGNLYRCKTAIGSGGEAWTSGHWDQVSVGTELTTLNNQIDGLSSYVNLGSLTESAADAALANLGATYSFCNVYFTISTAGSHFDSTQYVGTFYKVTGSRFYVQLFKGSGLQMLIGRYNSGSWTWQ